MTDKSCDDINSALALDAGWYKDDTGFWYHPKRRPKPSIWARVIDPNAGPLMGWKNPPDYCGDSKYTGALLEGLIQKRKGCVTFYTVGSRFGVAIKDIGEGIEGDTVIEAIARTAHAMLEEKR